MADKHARPLSKRKMLSLFSKIIPYTEDYSLEQITPNKPTSDSSCKRCRSRRFPSRSVSQNPAIKHIFCFIQYYPHLSLRPLQQNSKCSSCFRDHPLIIQSTRNTVRMPFLKCNSDCLTISSPAVPITVLIISLCPEPEALWTCKDFCAHLYRLLRLQLLPLALSLSLSSRSLASFLSSNRKASSLVGFFAPLSYPLCLESPCLGSSQILVLPRALLDPSLHYFWLPLCLQLKLSTELFFSVLVCLALFGSFKKTVKTSKARLCSPQAFSSLSFLSSGRTCFKHKFILTYTLKYESHMNIWNVYRSVFVAYCFGFLPMVPCFLCTWLPLTANYIFPWKILSGKSVRPGL